MSPTARAFKRFLTEVESRLGPLDVLINNAGIMPVGPFVAETDATADRMIDINLKGVIYGSKLALERFLPRNSGHLINIASVAGKGGTRAGPPTAPPSTRSSVCRRRSAPRSAATDIDVSIVMPVGVNTELYAGPAAPPAEIKDAGARGRGQRDRRGAADRSRRCLGAPHL